MHRVPETTSSGESPIGTGFASFGRVDRPSALDGESRGRAICALCRVDFAMFEKTFYFNFGMDDWNGLCTALQWYQTQRCGRDWLQEEVEKLSVTSGGISLYDSIQVGGKAAYAVWDGREVDERSEDFVRVQMYRFVEIAQGRLDPYPDFQVK